VERALYLWVLHMEEEKEMVNGPMLSRTDLHEHCLQLIIGTAVILILSHPLPSCSMLLSVDSRTCDGQGSIAFHGVLFLGPVY